MKILLAAPYGGITGGISRWTTHILDYYSGLNNQECVMELLTMNRSTFINGHSSLFFRLFSALKDYRCVFKAFYTKIKEEKYDLVHLTSSGSISLLKDLCFIFLAKQRNIKTVVHFRFGRIPEVIKSKNWECKLLFKVIERADAIIVIDKSSYEVLIEAGFTNITLLPNPLSPKVSEMVSLNNQMIRISRTILFVGHVVKTKGVFELVKACKEISNVTVKLVGKVMPDIETTLMNLSGHADWLEILGDRPYEEVIVEMLKSDIFVLPTYTEGFPNVIIEAMACGCAIVATKVGAIPEMLEEEDERKFGILVEPKNIEELKEAINNMLLDERFREECRVNVRQRVVERYNIASVWEQIVAIWKNMMINR